MSASKKDQDGAWGDGTPSCFVHPLAGSLVGLERILGGVEATLWSKHVEQVIGELESWSNRD